MKVAITDYEYANIDIERKIFADAGIELYDYQCKNEEELIEATRDKDGIIVQYCKMTPNVIEKLEHCKIIIKYGIGVDNIDIPAATAKKIFVCNVPDYGVEEVSNHTMAFLLVLARKLPALVSTVREGGFGYAKAVPTKRLSLCTLGLIGFGRIPQLVCQKAQAFGMHILTYDPYVKPEVVTEAGAELVDMDTLLHESDYLSCHCPLTDQTFHMIDAAAINKMKTGACIINTGRGGIICEKDLVAALKTGKLAGAALDVFEKEPLPADSELRGLPNVITTGHCAWYTEEAITTLQRKAAEEVVRVLQGNPPVNPVNRALLK